MGNAPRITKVPYVVVCAVGFVFAVARPSAVAQTIVHVRGIVLGTTPLGLDVGIADGSDVHFDMARDPTVAIAEYADTRALRSGERVGVVSPRSTETVARSVTIVPESVSFVRDGLSAWDVPGGTSMTTGSIVRCDRSHGRTSIVVAFPGGRRRFAVPARAAVVSLRPGTRLALVSPHTVFVFAIPPTDGLSLVVQRAVVGDGALQLPF